MELRDVEIADFLRALGQDYNINIILDEKITGKVTVSLQKVPLWDAIDQILRSKGFSYLKDGNILRVVQALEDEDLVTRMIKIKYYVSPKDPSDFRAKESIDSAKNLEAMVKKVLSKKGDVVYDQKSNQLIIRDIPSAIQKAEELLRQIDVNTGQVLIEAKIVEVSTNATKELGIQWSGNIYGSAWPNTFNSEFSVNTPASSSTGTLDFTFGYANIINIDLQLSALEEQGNARILSSPKVIVLDNQEATIASGSQVILRTYSIAGGVSTATGTSTYEATLRLTVVPKILENQDLSLKIYTKREEFDFSRSVDGIPPKDTRETQTGVIVKNGDTVVIGGIYSEKDTKDESGVPYLSKIPVLGWLFKKEAKTKDRNELLIFITPRIKVDAL
jgi:type IV pilus assembly protein PilQ